MLCRRRWDHSHRTGHGTPAAPQAGQRCHDPTKTTSPTTSATPGSGRHRRDTITTNGHAITAPTALCRPRDRTDPPTHDDGITIAGPPPAGRPHHTPPRRTTRSPRRGRQDTHTATERGPRTQEQKAARQSGKTQVTGQAAGSN